MSTPVPLELLAEHVFDDGSDYNDGLLGYSSASITDGVLTLKFERDQEAEAGQYDAGDFIDTEYRFSLSPIDVDSLRALGPVAEPDEGKELAATRAALDEMVEAGDVEVVGVDEHGDRIYRITDQGTARVEAMGKQPGGEG